LIGIFGEKSIAGNVSERTQENDWSNNSDYDIQFKPVNTERRSSGEY
jgi:hypothetical protein